ncbi:tetratricopeptide repeat protein [Sulfitobacter sp. 1151]|uniref:Tetratricopeptide repeat protein n=2 Tax=Parasulfitobacter algicola TaxID=2614809 RepID=A0ABX2IPB8_9RHOB|nr:tetratricopeptide repeat protein [Sulfitobacter algicola]NSX53831.1 tetratricopeptide repeat protein [Sulfitobacter algicola]
MADSPSGAYLSARHATFHSDYENAARFYVQALLQDPGNAELLENAMTAFVKLGQMDKAATLALQMQEAGIQSQVAHIVRAVDQSAKGNFSQLSDDIEAGRKIGPLIDGLIMAWAKMGDGNVSEAIDAFDNIGGSAGLRSFAYYHKALALASVGDFEASEAIFSSAQAGPLHKTRRGIMAHAEILSHLDRNSDAIAMLDDLFGADLSPDLQAIHNELSAGSMLDFTYVTTPRDGMAEVFFTIAAALSGDAAEDYTLLYTRAAEHLRPDHVDAILMSADLLEKLDRYKLATATYDRVPRNHPSFHTAELGRAESLRRAGNQDAAVEVLTQLIESHPQIPDVHVTLGDTLRFMNRYEEAIAAYDQAVDLTKEPRRANWFMYYARGITNERLDQWDAAEADFRKALELNPKQPQVLNYLGYSLVEQQIKLDEALGMIEQAAAARPNSGYIIDSLGWVLYKLGRFDEAVVQMERAAALMPTDAIVNDHLGDAYWAVGRKTEAEFQWNRALSFDPDQEETKRIRRKLEIGLDAVLAEEGADPLQLANEQN